MNQLSKTARDNPRRLVDAGKDFPQSAIVAAKDGTGVVEAVAAGYTVLKSLFTTETAPDIGRSGNHLPPEGMQPAAMAHSGVGRPSFAGFQKSPPLRRRFVYGHDHLMFMKSQLG